MLSVNGLQTTLHAQISLISVPEENDFRSNLLNIDIPIARIIH